GGLFWYSAKCPHESPTAWLGREDLDHRMVGSKTAGVSSRYPPSTHRHLCARCVRLSCPALRRKAGAVPSSPACVCGYASSRIRGGSDCAEMDFAQTYPSCERR